MSDSMKPVIGGCLYYSGLVPFLRWWERRFQPRLIILNYHRAEGNLRLHLLYLRRHYRILPLEAALEELYAPADHRPRRTDRRTALAITFDDGYLDNYTHASIIARNLRVPVSVFLPAGYIDSGNRFVWMEGDYLAQHTQVNRATILGHTYRLDKPGERTALAHAVDAYLRRAGSVAERGEFLASVRSALALSGGQTSEEGLTLPLSWSDAREMAAGGWVTFGAHTMHHPILSCLIDPAEVQYEVAESRSVLEQRLGHPVQCFAYPYGGLRDIGEPALQAAREAGYRWAVTTIPGFNTPQTDPYLLRRMHVDATDHWCVLAAEATGIWSSLVGLLLRVLGIPTDTGAMPLSVALASARWPVSALLSALARLRIVATRSMIWRRRERGSPDLASQR